VSCSLDGTKIISGSADNSIKISNLRMDNKIKKRKYFG
jgi:hypothetical protein